MGTVYTPMALICDSYILRSGTITPDVVSYNVTTDLFFTKFIRMKGRVGSTNLGYRDKHDQNGKRKLHDYSFQSVTLVTAAQLVLIYIGNNKIDYLFIIYFFCLGTLLGIHITQVRSKYIVLISHRASKCRSLH